jgi:hypothetical protein
MSEDYTYDAAMTFPDKVTAQIADLQAQLMQINTQVQDLAVIAYQQKEKIEHLEAWVHKLLNPNGNGES